MAAGAAWQGWHVGGVGCVRVGGRDEACLVFFNDTATTEIYTLSLHDALPIFEDADLAVIHDPQPHGHIRRVRELDRRDRKSTRLNSSHANISYAVFCLKKNNPQPTRLFSTPPSPPLTLPPPLSTMSPTPLPPL